MRMIPYLVMTLLLVLGAAVQLNDPDPIRWVLIYSAGAGVSVAGIFRPAGLRWAAGAVAAVAAVWALTIAAGGLDPIGIGELFGTVGMKTEAVELWRETLGLLIIAGWCVAVARRAPRDR